MLTCTTSALDYVSFQYNGITTTTYSCIELYGNGATAASNYETGANMISIDAGGTIGSSTTIPELYTIDVFSYAGATNKTSLHAASMDHNGSGEVISSVGLWRSTAPITSIKLLGAAASNFNAGTIATLWGI